MKEQILAELRKWAARPDPHVRLDILAELVGVKQVDIRDACMELRRDGLIESVRMRKPGERQSKVHYRALPTR